MSNFLEIFLAVLAGIVVFSLLETAYYEVKSRLSGRQYERYIEYLEEEMQGLSNS